MGYLASISRATCASLSFRRSVLSRPLMSSGQRFRASCMVMVENPSATRNLKMLFLMAPNTRYQSMPWCS